MAALLQNKKKNMRFSAKLKKAMKEIQGLLDEYDIAASVVLHTPGHTEYLMHITPSYSCAKLEGSKFFVNTKSLNLSKRDKREMIANTANMLNGLATTTGRESLKIIKLSEIMDKHSDARHTDLGHTSQEELDN